MAGVAAPVLEVVCMGEALVDFLPGEPGRRVREVTTWRPCSGGAPSNVAVGLARLGARVAFVGVVGEDEFGHFLRERLAAEGVDVSRMRQTAEARTGLAFISLDARGERSFAFFRTRSAEFLLGERDVHPDLLGSARVVHCGTNSLLLPEARSAMRRALEAARGAGRIVSCDPNLRLGTWPDLEALRELLGRLLPLCTVVKLSEEEVAFVTGRADVEGGLEHLAGLGVRLPVVTLGEAGAALLWEGRVVRIPAPPARVVDTTGAGDGFMAAFLYGLTRCFGEAAELARLTREELVALATFACAVGSRVVEHTGAVAGLPRLAEVWEVLPASLRSSWTTVAPSAHPGTEEEGCP